MKKTFVIMSLIILLVQSLAFGAVSNDMNEYVRKDVFDAKMEALMSNIHNEIQELSRRMDVEFANVRGDIKALNERFDSMERHIDGVEKRLDNRIDDLRSNIYLGLVVLGIIAGLSTLNKFMQWFENRRPAFTLEDVERLIDAKLNAKAQV